LRPKAFVFENVKGLLRSTFSEYFEYIILRLEYPNSADLELSNWREHLSKLRRLAECPNTPPEYHVQYKLINAADYGIPQTRERVIIVGVRADINREWTFPEGKHSLECLLWDQYVSGEYWERHGISEPLDYNHSSVFLKKIDKLKTKYGLFPPSGKPWVTMRDILYHLPNPNSAHEIIDHLYRDGARSYPGHTGSMYDMPSKTIKAGAHGVPGGENMIRYSDDSIRYLTVHEAKLIQGFPSDFRIHGAWGEAMRQIGNAVPVAVAKEIGRNLKSVLASSSKSRDAA